MTRTVEVPVLTRVEGEGALHVRIEQDKVKELQLRIFEPPRFFEKFLEGRTWREVPDVVARICGICPVAYQMSAVHAIEMAFGMQITPEIRALRRLYYCGEWIESHSLHIHLLAAPDFLGYPDAIRMAKDHPEAVRRGMRIQALGNDIIKIFGGRPVNPVGVLPGGFYRPPRLREFKPLLERVEAAIPDTEAVVRWLATLDLPKMTREANFVSMRHPDEYPMNEGRIVGSRGLDFAATEFEKYVEERHMPHSTALHARINGEPYFLGPLARLNNNLDRLPPETKKLLDDTKIAWPSSNPYHSALARAVEIHLALIEARRLMRAYRQLSKGYVDATVQAGVGMAATEAPRGILWHRYEMDDRGLVKRARIVPPTSQNQAQIEADLTATVHESLTLTDDALRQRLEASIRNYDPCISCSTHFLRLTVERS
jgi:coenzyme F420-reducing hydrogenase alpha subunit